MNPQSESPVNGRRFHSQLEAQIAEKYQKLGFIVTPNPSPSQLPFDLDSYIPDLIARKEPDQNYIIEIKGGIRQISVDKLRSIAEIVQSHPGWRFLLVTADDEPALGSEPDLLQYDEARSRTDQAESLLAAGAEEASFLFLWSTLEGMMRRHAIETAIPVDRLSSLAMTNHLYSQGELSREQFHQIKELTSIRNRTAHGYREAQLGQASNKLLSLVRDLINEWKGVQ